MHCIMYVEKDTTEHGLFRYLVNNCSEQLGFVDFFFTKTVDVLCIGSATVVK